MDKMGCVNSSTPRTINNWPDPKDVDTVPFKGQKILVKVVSVYDGDTCTILIPFAQDFIKLNVRVLGVDTPELKLRGADKDTSIGKLEMEAGAHVRDKVKKLIEGKECYVVLTKWDKYGGRVNGTIYLPQKNGGVEKTLTQYLLEKRYAKGYTGNKKDEWTRAELKYMLEH